MEFKDKPTLHQLSDIVIKELKQHGFKIQRYDAYSTKSIYLKLDYGVCNSIRISDHKGKKGLNYRYNLLTHLDYMNQERTSQGWIRAYYPPNWTDIMIQDIVRDRDERLKRYGEDSYKHYMKKNKLEYQNSPGFWSKCKEI